MKLTNIKSATVLIEHNGVRVLCDPWLKDGIYIGSWFHYPKLSNTSKDFENVDYLYLSHIHPDHSDPETIKDFRKDVKILICEYKEKYFKRSLEKMGFTNIIEVPNRTEYPLGLDFKVEIMAGDNCNANQFGIIHRCAPPKDYTKTLQIDSLAIFTGGGRVICNTNDVPLGLIAPSLGYVKTKYPEIDLLLVSYAGAGPFPQSYVTPDGQMRAIAMNVAHNFLGNTVGYIAYLNPKYFMPFAGQYTLGGKCYAMNQFKGVVDLDDLKFDLVPSLELVKNKSIMIIPDTGGTIDVETMTVDKEFKGTDFVARRRYIDDVLSKFKFPYELEYKIDPSIDLLPKLKLAHKRLQDRQLEFKYFSNWNIYLDLGTAVYRVSFDGQTEVHKVDRGDFVSPYQHVRLDHSLMNMILDRKANWNNAEVGSHLIYNVELGPHAGHIRGYEPMTNFLMPYFQAV